MATASSIATRGELIASPRLLARIEALRIPPAWEEVWICRRANGHVQATGRDAKGRKQYRYHPDWSATRNETKYGRMAEFGAALPNLRERIDIPNSQFPIPFRRLTNWPSAVRLSSIPNSQFLIPNS